MKRHMAEKPLPKSRPEVKRRPGVENKREEVLAAMGQRLRTVTWEHSQRREVSDESGE